MCIKFQVKTKDRNIHWKIEDNKEERKCRIKQMSRQHLSTDLSNEFTEHRTVLIHQRHRVKHYTAQSAQELKKKKKN